MDRSDSHLAWGFHYNPLLPQPRTVLVTDRESYSYSTMSADRGGSYLAPCYWPSPYSGPYGVGPQPSTPVNNAKRNSINPCECSSCVTTSSQTYKPAFAHSTDSLVKNQPVNQMQGFPSQKEMSQNSDGSDVQQNYSSKAVSPPRMCIPSDPLDNIGPRRGRTVFTAQQLQVLERVFASTQYIVGSQRKFLANQLRLSETQVRVWFQNRRIKWRKQMLTRSITS